MAAGEHEGTTIEEGGSADSQQEEEPEPQEQDNLLNDVVGGQQTQIVPANQMVHTQSMCRSEMQAMFKYV